MKKEFSDKQTQTDISIYPPPRTEPTFLTTRLTDITMEHAIRLANRSSEWYEDTLKNTMMWVSREMRRVRVWWFTALKDKDEIKKEMFEEVYCYITDYHLALEDEEDKKDREAGCHFHCVVDSTKGSK